MSERVWGISSIALLAAFASATVTAPTAAQVATVPAEGITEPTSGEEGLGEIVVTAQKRSENLQKVPISVAVVTSNQLTASGIASIQNLKIAAPGVEVQSLNGYAMPVIRGVGNKATLPGVEPPVAFYIDGVYYATSSSTLLSFNNIDQVEILKGPQGTLFGRNATGGLMQITTRDPSQDVHADLSLSYGNYETVKGAAYVSGGITDNVAADLAISATHMGDGYGTNMFNGKDIYKVDHEVAFRSKWLFGLGDATEARFILDYSDYKNSMNATRMKSGTTAPLPFGPNYGGSAWASDTDEQPQAKNKGGGASLRLDHDFGGINAMSLTAYRESDARLEFDFDYTRTRGRYVHLRQKDWQFSQELQFLSPSGSPITWVAGAYYFRANSRYPYMRVFFEGPAAQPTTPPTVLSTTKSAQKTDSISFFGQSSAELLEGLKATVGLRYTSEKRTLADASTVNTRADGSTVTTIPEFTRSQRFKKLTWRFALDYDVTRDILAYASFNRGFKSGGFNTNALAIGAFEPEVLDSYEVGLKTQLLDRRVRLNLSGFYYDYDKIQVQRIINGFTGIYNSGKTEIYGGEVELEARPIDELQFKLGYQYLHGKYKDFQNAVFAAPRPAGGYTIGVGNASGKTTVLTPESTFSASGTYELPVGNDSLAFTVGYYYNSGYYHEPDNLVRQKAYDQINASVRYQMENGLALSVWGNNLTNEAVANFNGIQSFGATGIERITYAPPRTYGVTAAFKF